MCFRQHFYARNTSVKLTGRVKERLVLFNAPKLINPIWIHAVSYGEAVLAEQLVKALKHKIPLCDVVVTTTTLTGSERIQKTLGNQVFHVFLPYDLPIFVRRFLRKIKPSLLVILETELWPGLLYQSRQAGIPVFLANARLSEKSARGYGYILPLVHFMLKQLTQVGAQTEQDAQRFLQLGLSPEKVSVMGCIKYDLQIPESVLKQGRGLREAIGKDRLVWVAGSTHEGEEALILMAFESIKKVYPDAVLILVPRHPERFEGVAQLCKEKKYHLVQRSKAEAPLASTDVLLGDTLGELLIFYAASDIAFVGGSFVPVGGHNVLEAVALNVPVFIGPYFHNFTNMIDQLKARQAIQIVDSPVTLAEELIALMQNIELLSLQQEQAQYVLKENQGALAKYSNQILTYLECIKRF